VLDVGEQRNRYENRALHTRFLNSKQRARHLELPGSDKTVTNGFATARPQNKRHAARLCFPPFAGKSKLRRALCRPVVEAAVICFSEYQFRL
jgi:hypothetical protein